jgi:hypothetical protein
MFVSVGGFVLRIPLQIVQKTDPRQSLAWQKMPEKTNKICARGGCF